MAKVIYTLMVKKDVFNKMMEIADKTYQSFGSHPLTNPTRVGVTTNKNIIFIKSIEFDDEGQILFSDIPVISSLKNLTALFNMNDYRLTVSYDTGETSIIGRLDDPEFALTNVTITATTELRDIEKETSELPDVISTDLLESFFKSKKKEYGGHTDIDAKRNENIGVYALTDDHAIVWVVINGKKYHFNFNYDQYEKFSDDALEAEVVMERD